MAKIQILDPVFDPNKIRNRLPTIKLSSFKVLDYAVGRNGLVNPDGTMPATIENCLTEAGPGPTSLGELPLALKFGSQGRASVQLGNSRLGGKVFSLRICFQATEPVLARQNLVESDQLPVAVFLEKTDGGNQFKLLANVGTVEFGWLGLDSADSTTLALNQWYVADVVYSADTLALYLNGKVVGMRALAAHTLLSLPGNRVFLGTWIDGSRYHFSGKIAALQVHSGVPADLANQALVSRTQPEWFVSHKLASLSPATLGSPVGKLTLSQGSASFQQSFQQGQLHYSPSVGVAFALQGAIYQYYQTLSLAVQQSLGFLVSDEVEATVKTGRKSLFQKGAIYWSAATGAMHVTGQLYLDYENLGESIMLGFPKSRAQAIAGGVRQEFEGCQMYQRTGTERAFEVHGAILQRYLALGGPDKLGFPVSNEENVLDGAAILGKVSHFEHGDIYWRKGVGSWEVYGDIRTKYDEYNGPIGPLGFPTSGEADVPGGAGRYNTFEQGSIVWFGSPADTHVCTPFRVRVGRVESEEYEDILMGQNDLTVDMYLEGLPTGEYHTRFPETGCVDNQNNIDVDRLLDPVVVPNRADLVCTFRADVWDIDDHGDNDLIGNYKHTLSIANAWGMRDNQGVFNNESEFRIRRITWAIQPVLQHTALPKGQWWWGHINTGITPTTYAQYAAAFTDVDSQPESHDLTDDADELFYDLVAKDLAASGRCVGMCIEALLAWKKNSLFSLPLSRFTDKSVTSNELTIKHQRQVGAPAVWWFAGQLLTGNTHDPVAVFEQTQLAYSLNQQPMLCVAQNYDFSGKPHALLPHAWEKNGNTWRIHVFDPNVPTSNKPGGEDPTRFVEINAADNTFTYVGENTTYSGGAWSGGRLHYLPWFTLCGRPRSSFWEGILLMKLGTLIILGDDAQTQSLTDQDGVPLDIFHPEAIARRKAGQSMQRHFVSYKGFDRSLPAQLYLRQGRDDNRKSLIKGNAKDVINYDFVHVVKGDKTGQFNYLLKSFATEVRLTSAMSASDTHTLAVKDLQRENQQLTVKTSSSKSLNIEIVNRLGITGDFMRLTIDQLPVAADKPLQLRVQAGLGGFDIIPNQDAISTALIVESVVKGQKQRKKFTLSLEGGVRILHASVSTHGELLVGKLDAATGRVADFHFLRGQ